MIGWWRARLVWLVLASTAIAAVGAYFAWPTGMLLPNLPRSSTNSFSVGYALAFVPALTWLAIVSVRKFQSEELTTRALQLGALDAALALIPSSAVMIVLISVGSPTIQGVGRNFLFASSLCLLAYNVSSTLPTFALPMGYFLAAGMFGFGSSRTVPLDWAFVLDRWDQERDLPIILVTMLVAISLQGLRATSRASRHEVFSI